MYCIIGLGNPGKQYQLTRHNAGFLAVDNILQKLAVGVEKGFKSVYCKTVYQGNPLLIVKPQTFMNLSGEAALEIVRFYKIPLDKLLIIYDDLDLPIGGLRFRQSGSAGGHNGLKSIIQLLGTDKIARVRIGIGHPVSPLPVVDYVLTACEGEERLLFDRCIEKAAEAALSFVCHGPDYTMNHFNTKSGPKPLKKKPDNSEKL